VFNLLSLIVGPSEAINGANTKINVRTSQTNFSELKISKELTSWVCYTQSLKCRISSSIVSTQRMPDLLHPESLNILTAIVFWTTMKKSLYKHTYRGRKNGVAPFESIDCN